MARSFVFASSLALVLFASEASAEEARDLGGEARAIFQVRCAGCHGADLAKPKGGFGYILDLARLASNPDLVIPGSPAQSTLWIVIDHDEMPAPDSPSGPLTDHEKQTIRAWIGAGAPKPANKVVKAVGKQPMPVPARLPNVQNTSSAIHRLYWFGRFHLLLLHFPIALLLAAAVGELLSAWRGEGPSRAVRFCLNLGAASAVGTAALGWLYALSGHGSSAPGTLALHRWIGTTGALWAVATAGFSELDAHLGVRSRHVRIMVFAAGLLVALAAHFGGILAHGEGFFAW